MKKTVKATIIFLAVALPALGLLCQALMGREIDGTFILGALSLPVPVCGYFLPSIVAVRRNHPRVGWIFCLNFVLGWMVIPWIVLLLRARFGPVVARFVHDCDRYAMGFEAASHERAEPRMIDASTHGLPAPRAWPESSQLKFRRR